MKYFYLTALVLVVLGIGLYLGAWDDSCLRGRTTC